MSSLFDYYREPLFSAVFLVFLALIAGFASSLSTSLRSRHFLERAKAFASSLAQPAGDELSQLPSHLLAEFAAALLAAGNYLRAKSCYAILLSRGRANAYELALCDIRLQLYSQAVNSCELALLHTGQDARALRALVYASYKLGDLSTALDAARSLALLGHGEALEYLSGKTDFRQIVPNADEIALCPHCGAKVAEAFCSGCFELVIPQIYSRKRT